MSDPVVVLANTQMKIAVIGAGMAGLSCAESLKDAGHSVAVFDKGRGPGGRMSTRRLQTPLGAVAFDHGAQYFTARNPAFRRLVGEWAGLGIAALWPAAGPDAWVGVPAMNEIIKHMAQSHAVAWGHAVTGLVRTDREWWLMGKAGRVGPYNAVVLAIPAEQAAAILSLHDFAMMRIALMARSQPSWTSMFVFDRPLDGLPLVMRSGGDLVWAARNSAKPGRSGPEAWVVQASASWSQGRIDASQEDISAELRAAWSQAAGCVIPEPVAAASHRWRYALSAGTGDGALWNQSIGLGVCGDWLLGPRVECAWLSGQMLANRCIGSGEATDGASATPPGLLAPAGKIE